MPYPRRVEFSPARLYGTRQIGVFSILARFELYAYTTSFLMIIEFNL